MTKRQIEELAKLYLDIGKLTLVALGLEFFHTNNNTVSNFITAIGGLIISAGFFIMFETF